ncbi:exonuclease domain-containing protein [Nocardiopsis sp. NPDC006938]|uniref:3'-5' exonuclease n=1 Tax=Nocardiopsis sp. NPDC006938 TaxID=3364337 RepID=UPI0036CF1F0D
MDTAPLRPVGAVRTAAALAERTGWPVRARDVDVLVDQGHLHPAGRYEGHTLYDRDQTTEIPDHVIASLPGMSPVPPGPSIHDFAVYLEQEYDVEVTVSYRARTGRWHLDWVPLPSGDPDPAGLRADLAAHPASRHRRLVDMATPAHRAIAAARRALTPDAAAVVDVETTGLGADAAIVEIAVVETHSGDVLLDTLVSPDGVPIERGAQQVHGITEADLAGAPTWPEVWPRLREAVQGRVLVAYNADFDRRLLRQACRRYDLRLPRWEWACAMAWRGAAARTSSPGALGGRHRALGDALATRDVVRRVANTVYVVEA